MKKVIALALAMAMALSMTSMAIQLEAADPTTPDTKLEVYPGGTYNYEIEGMEYTETNAGAFSNFS